MVTYAIVIGQVPLRLGFEYHFRGIRSSYYHVPRMGPRIGPFAEARGVSLWNFSIPQGPHVPSVCEVLRKLHLTCRDPDGDQAG